MFRNYDFPKKTKVLKEKENAKEKPFGCLRVFGKRITMTKGLRWYRINSNFTQMLIEFELRRNKFQENNLKVLSGLCKFVLFLALTATLVLKILNKKIH